MAKPIISTEHRALLERRSRLYNRLGIECYDGCEDGIESYMRYIDEINQQIAELKQREADESATVTMTVSERDRQLEAAKQGGMDDAIQQVADVCKREMERYWHNEETLRDNGESINSLNTRTAGMLMGFVGVFDALGCEMDFKIDWFDAECRIHQVTARRKGDFSVVLSMQNLGKDEWWA